jgi:LacI family transcriptional regulator, galactose operon repressor
MNLKDSRAPRIVTLKQVAADAGVHSSTVSRALNPRTRHMVTDDLVHKVLSSVKRLGYSPNSAAASLRTGTSRLVGVVLPDLFNSVFAPILGGITEALYRDGYATIIADAGQEGVDSMELIDRLIGRQVDGLILATAARHDEAVASCIERGVPVVLVNRAEEDGKASAVVSDDEKGMALAVDHLVELGHKAIGHIAGLPNLSTGHRRRRGYEMAMRAHGLPVGPIETASAYSREAGRIAAARLLDRQRVSAIVAANDLLAVGVYEEITARGLSCPADMSIVGHNDMPLVDMLQPPLTTVRISHREMGREAAQLLLRNINEASSLAARNVVLTPTLVVRGSTAAPKSA